MRAWSRIFKFLKELKQLGVNLFEFPDNLKKRCGSMVVCCSVIVVVDAASTLRACSVDNDDDQTANDCASTLFLQVIGELEQVNSQLFQLFEKLENPAPCMHPSSAITINLQQPSPCPEPQPAPILQCISHGVLDVPPAPNPKQSTAVPSAVLWKPQSPPTIINNVTMEDVDGTYMQ